MGSSTPWAAGDTEDSFLGDTADSRLSVRGRAIIHHLFQDLVTPINHHHA